MNEMELFTIFDNVAQRYMKPFWAENVAAAIRGFGDACQDETTPFYDHPSDYDLYHLASFNGTTAELKVCVMHKVASATSFMHHGKQLDMKLEDHLEGRA